MFLLLLLQLIAFSIFPLYFITLSGPLRQVHFYIYMSLILLIGGFMGNVYSMPIAEGVVISGGNLCYSAFMMTSVMFVWIEKDVFIIRHLVRLVIIVDLFNIVLSYLTQSILQTDGIINLHTVPSEIFMISVPLIMLGGVLIIAELILLLFIFEMTKKTQASLFTTAPIYILSFILVLLLDGIAFSFIAFGISDETIAIALGGLAGKALMAIAFSIPLALFILWKRQAFTDYLRSDTVRWHFLASSSADLIKEMARKDLDVRRGDIVFKNATDGLAIVDQSGAILKANTAFKKMLGEENSEVESLNIDNTFWINNIPLKLSSNPTEKWRREVQFGNGIKRFGILSVTSAGEDLYGSQSFVYSLTDITEQKDAQNQLEYLASHDQLTELPNRRVLDRALNLARNRPHVLVMLDIDHFKDINDSYGHTVGDRVLQVVAERLDGVRKQHLGEEDVLCRIGGDEFAFLIQTSDKNVITQAVNRIQRTFKETVKINNGIEVFSTATLGISYQANMEAGDALLQADAALYEAKRNKRGSVGIYEDRLTTESQKQMKLGFKLKNALINKDIVVHYQPQFDAISHEVRGIEALARWTDSEMGIVAPSDFIPVAERTGLVDILGEYVLETVCRDGQRWLQNGLKPIIISVNVSASQLRFGSFKSVLTKTLQRTGFPASKLEIEVTESSYIERESEVTPLLQAIKEMGVSIAVDDFGTGYSSLSYLREMPWSVIKIDRSFIIDIPTDVKQCNLTSAIIKLAKVMSFKVVAEGVENQEQLDFLTKEGCDLIQGYYFSPPLSPKETEILLSDSV
ncbi:putative bifunctional diguanylate cyclase/phosphodiesterase [Pectobacterium sp. B1J-3]|uniref:putative bifunctional diguanylate cyclase/phosphodiesterase n=1 Tax=Pectobacterium sp. B1J-3 TaxID=3385371 RepID=UPI003905E5E8